MTCALLGQHAANRLPFLIFQRRIILRSAKKNHDHGRSVEKLAASRKMMAKFSGRARKAIRKQRRSSPPRKARYAP